MSDGTDLVATDGNFQDDVAIKKRAVLDITNLLEERCTDEVDAQDIAARLSHSFKMIAHFAHPEPEIIEQAIGVGMAAFLDYKSEKATPRRTRPQG